MTANPVLVEATRGGIVESAHRGAIAVVDVDGGLALGLGDIERAVFPRSSVKALQALALFESGAAERFGLGDAELSLACSSHLGEPRHLEVASGMLARAHLGASALECGGHWPLSEDAARALAAAGGAPTALHNTCSGKHAGFVLACAAMGVAPQGYVDRAHPLMARIEAILSEMTGAPLGPAALCGVDGCSIPAYAFPLKDLARAFARFATGAGMSPQRAAAAQAIRQAVAAAPAMIAGEGAFDTEITQACGAAVFLKTGAEGVYCGAFPELGLGVALKCDDGSKRAGEIMMAALIQRFAPGCGETAVARYAPRPLRNAAGREIGVLRAAGPLAGV